MPEIQRIPSTAGYPLSRAIRAGDLLLLSGQIPHDAQTDAVLKRIGETLELAGAIYSDVVRTTVWLSDIGDFAAFHEVYRG